MIIETLSANFVEALVEAPAPLAQRAAIIEAHVVETVQVETPGPLHRLVHAVEREQEGAWKNVLLDPVHAAAQLGMARIGIGDELGGKNSVGLEQALDALAVRLEVLIADGLHHLDADDLVELAGQ